MSINPETIIIKNKNLLDRDVKDGSVLYDIKKGNVHVLNSYASFVWLSMEDECVFQDLVNSVKQELSDSQIDHNEKISELIKKFIYDGLIEIKNSES
ncbi:MAG: PqqD family peptide modification chaperone [Pseudomonadota bacterium]